MAATQAALAEASEALVADFERLVAKTANIAELIEQINHASDEFRNLVNESLTACDALASELVTNSMITTKAADASLVDFVAALQTATQTMRSEASNLVGLIHTDLGGALDDRQSLLEEMDNEINVAVSELETEVKGLLSDLSGQLDQIDGLWLQAQGSVQQVHSEIRSAILSFASSLGKNTEELGTKSSHFANDLEQSVFKPVEDMLGDIEKELGIMGARIFEKGFDELSGQLEKAIRAQVAELIDQALVDVKQMVTEKIDQILERRDKSEPERKALDSIFDILNGFISKIQSGSDQVGDIRAIVGQ